MARLSDVSPGDLITSQRQNDINDYIQDGTEYVITSDLQLVATDVEPSGDLAKGRIYMDDSESQLKVYDGATWTPVGGAAVYSEAITNETSVAITHSLGVYPFVQVRDTGNELIIPDTITHDTVNQITLTFANQQSGTVMCIAGTGGSIPAGANAGAQQTFTAQTSVSFTHNIGNYPVIQVLNNSDEWVIPESITHNSVNAATVTFSTATTGRLIASYSGTTDAQAGVYVAKSGDTMTGNLAISSTATSGNDFNVTRDKTAASTDSPVASIVQDNTGDDQVALNIQQDSSQSGGHGILLNQNGTNGTALRINHTPTASTAVRCHNVGSTRRAEMLNSSGHVGYFYRDQASGDTSQPVVQITNSPSSDDQPALSVYSANSSSAALEITQVHAQGTDLKILKSVALGASGKMLHVESTNATSEGEIIYARNANGAARVIRANSASATSDILFLHREVDDAGVFINFYGTSGSGKHINTAALGAYAFKVKVKINGSPYWLPIYN